MKMEGKIMAKLCLVDSPENSESFTGTERFFTDQSMARLMDTLHFQTFKADSAIFWEGDTVDNIYFIKSGQIKAFKVTDDGKELILSWMQSGDLLCELGGGSDHSHTYSAYAVTDCELGMTTVDELETLIYQYGEFAIEFMNWMSAWQRTLQTKLRDLLLFGKPGALASTIVRLTNSYGEPISDGIKITVKLTNSELASMIGTTRESVNRILKTFKDDGLIRYEQGDRKSVV